MKVEADSLDDAFVAAMDIVDDIPTKRLFFIELTKVEKNDGKK